MVTKEARDTPRRSQAPPALFHKLPKALGYPQSEKHLKSLGGAGYGEVISSNSFFLPRSQLSVG